jgi:hypothetical protein
MANTYDAIATVTVGSGGAATIEFTSIPATYTDLVVKYSLRCTAAETGTNLTINGSSASTYTWRDARSNGATASSADGIAQTALNGGRMTMSTDTANTFSNNEIYIPNYAGSNNKSVSVDTVTENNATTALMAIIAGLRANTDAITSLTWTPGSGNFAQYSTATLYGIKKN